MTRRNWIKIYPEGFLRRTLYSEIPDPGERWAWIGLLCLAGDNAFDGKICITETMGYTDEQIAAQLCMEVEIFKSAKKKMIKFEKISADKNNIIQILGWKKYQSEYQRQRDYREEYKKIRESYNEKLQRKITTESADVLQYISLSISLSLSKDINLIDINNKIDINKYNDKEYLLSLILYKYILNNNPKCKEPDGIMWATHIDKMIRLDNREPQEIYEVIKWCQEDDFWKTNILSTEKLRKQYDQLYIKMSANMKAKKKNSDWKEF